jgi:hypothetical protein
VRVSKDAANADSIAGFEDTGLFPHR